MSGERPACPTVTLPGTAAWVAVLVQRADRRESLFHPLDVGFTGCPKGGSPPPESPDWPYVQETDMRRAVRARKADSAFRPGFRFRTREPRDGGDDTSPGWDNVVRAYEDEWGWFEGEAD